MAKIRILTLVIDLNQESLESLSYTGLKIYRIFFSGIFTSANVFFLTNLHRFFPIKTFFLSHRLHLVIIIFFSWRYLVSFCFGPLKAFLIWHFFLSVYLCIFFFNSISIQFFSFCFFYSEFFFFFFFF